MFAFLQGQIAAITTALHSVVLAIPERRELVDEHFAVESDAELDAMAEDFPEAVYDGYRIWADDFDNFLEAGADAEAEVREPPPDAANDPEKGPDEPA